MKHRKNVHVTRAEVGDNRGIDLVCIFFFFFLVVVVLPLELGGLDARYMAGTRWLGRLDLAFSTYHHAIIP